MPGPANGEIAKRLQTEETHFEEDGEIKLIPGALKDDKKIPIELIPELKMPEGQSLQ